MDGKKLKDCNFRVSPPRIAARKRPSGFNANLHCHQRTVIIISSEILALDNIVVSLLKKRLPVSLLQVDHWSNEAQDSSLSNPESFRNQEPH
jgi:hypothetical protein